MNSTGRRLLITAFLFTTLLYANLSVAADTLSSGEFTGASNHETSGTVSVVMDGEARSVVLGDDFSFDGAPDPKVGFGKDGKYDLASQLDILKSNSGGQSYAIPADLDISGYNEIYIWCEAYSVPLGVATIK